MTDKITHTETTLQTARLAVLIAIETAATRVTQCEASETTKGEGWATTARELAMAYINMSNDDD